MKKIISLLLVAIMSVSLVACGSNETSNKDTDEKAAAQSEKETNSSEEIDLDDMVWISRQEEDEFGDVKEDGKIILETLIEGTFSNTATADSELKGYIFVEPRKNNHKVFVFRLMEYGKSPATFTSSEAENITLKTKINDETEEYKLFGAAPTSDLALGFDNIADGDGIFTALCNGNDVKCIISIGSSEYKFTIKSGNIMRVIDYINEKAETEN